MNYLEVPAYAISDGTLRLASLAADVVARVIGTPPVAIRWFQEGNAVDWPWKVLQDERPDVIGIVQQERPRTVWLHASLSGFTLVNTVAHEVMHSRQLTRGVLPVTARQREFNEAEARSFGDAYERQVRAR